jgi:hypothetical protein
MATELDPAASDLTLHGSHAFKALTVNSLGCNSTSK